MNLRFSAFARILAALSVAASLGAFAPRRAAAEPERVYDLAAEPSEGGTLKRVLGSTGNGQDGTPIAGPFDCDGDGHMDFALGHITASPLSRNRAGEIEIIFGDGSTDGVIDTAAASPNILRIYGAGALETAGVEIWIDDVTGDGLGDLMIGRQNFNKAPRTGPGALTIVVGGAWTRELAAALAPLDLAAPPESAVLFTVIGARSLDRLGVWMRAGDVTGDGVADVLVGADQAAGPSGEAYAGEAYLLKGGGHLATNASLDLAAFGTPAFEATGMAGRVARLRATAGSAGYHLAATCALADLDHNGRDEVLLAATINRASAAIPAYGADPSTAKASGGAPDGRVYIAWDDNFTTSPWPADFTMNLASPPGALTVVSGAPVNNNMGEEIASGDFNHDGLTDLFLGDLTADGSPGADRVNSGIGYIFFAIAEARGRAFAANAPPTGVARALILGPSSGAIGADTVAPGDFDGDGMDDLAFGSPRDSPSGRTWAGSVQVMFGRTDAWPALIDLAPAAMPAPDELRITEIRGAFGNITDPVFGFNFGDTICYSASVGDMDGDGRADLLINEMTGDGSAPSRIDVGNLLIINGRGLARSAATRRETLDHLLGKPAPQGDLIYDANTDKGVDIADALAARAP